MGTSIVTTDYDDIADDYVLSKMHPWRTHIECHSLNQAIGDPTGSNVLDLACGDGFHTRHVKRSGAARTVGVDLSQAMIDRANAREALERLGIEFVQADARSLPDLGQFDLVVAAYLLNYARDSQELAQMLGSVARSLKPGGRFVTINANPFFDFAATPDFRKYGFDVRSDPGKAEGSPILWSVFLEDGTFEIENYFLSPATHERVLKECGFRDIRWRRPDVSAEGIATFGAAFWRAFLDRPPVVVLECRYEVASESA